MSNAIKVEAPALDHDAMMLSEFGRKVGLIGKADRRVVANMINVLTLAGFQVCALNDGDGETPVSDMKSAMELIFNLDDCYLFFRDTTRRYWVRLVMGNSGWDVINDYCNVGTFAATLNAFDGEEYM